MIHGYETGWCSYIKLRRFRQDPPKRKSPTAPVWLHAFIRQCERDRLYHVDAIVLFMSQTGARVSEAVRLLWAQVDLEGRTALLLKTKSSVNSRRYLTTNWSPGYGGYAARRLLTITCFATPAVTP